MSDLPLQSAAWITAKGRGKTRGRSVDACRKRVEDGCFYLISRHGGWFRPNAHGYTVALSDAGVFDAATARRYLDVDGLSVIAVKAVTQEIKAAVPALDQQVEALKRMLSNA